MAGSMTITVADECESYLQALGADIPNWRSKALRSLGWMMQDAIKRGIKSKSPGGKPYPMRHRMSAFDRNMMHPELMQSRYPPLGKLVQAIGYQYREKQQAVLVGWLSRSAAALGRKVQDPQPIPDLHPLDIEQIGRPFAGFKGPERGLIKPLELLAERHAPPPGPETGPRTSAR